MVDPNLAFLLDVLDISDGHTTEDELDEQLRHEAKQLGLVVQEQEHAAPFAASIHHPRRPTSIDSRASQSTGIVSTYSDMSMSRDPPFGYTSQRRLSRASLSFRDYDAFLSRGVPNSRQSLTFSPLTTPSNSVFSLPLSQPPTPDLSPRRTFRRIRGLSMLRLHNRSTSDAPLAQPCPHCPQDATSQRRAVHKLSCGHRLCTQALRNTINMAIDSKANAVPSCCGRPISGSLVEQVMTHDEQNALLEKLEQWDEAISIPPSIASGRRGSMASSIPSSPSRPTPMLIRGRTMSDEEQRHLLDPKQRKELDKLMATEDYQLLRTGQSDQRDRFLRWADMQRSEAEKKYDDARKQMRLQHETAADDMAEHHASAMSEAEDKQVKAESDLRETQAQERRDNATALKHLEAHCAGTYINGEPHNRPITDQSLMELDKARRARDQMDIKHESQINVLRGEQSRRMRLRSTRQERELQDLKVQQRKEELEVESSCTRELRQLEETIASKQRKIQWRWELQMAILSKKIEAETGMHVDCRLPTATWTIHADEQPSVPSKPANDPETKHGITSTFALRGGNQQHMQMGG